MGQVKKTSREIPQDASLLKVVRVALFYEKPRISVGTEGPYEIRALSGNETLNEGALLAMTPVRPEISGIRVGTAVYPVSGLRFTSRAREVQIENRKYRDAVSVLKNPSGTLTVVNEIDVEDYLKGVLPSEMNARWPEEALKAQAVSSRTYAIFKNIENKDFPFSLGSDVGSQVYGGKTVESDASTRAAEATRGQILTHRGKIFPAFFHSTCGGATTRADYQWKVEAHPSLKGVDCPFCRGSGFYAWKAEFSAGEIRRLLARKGQSLGGIRDIKPDEIDASGRPHFFIVEHGTGSLQMSANEFRQALGVDRMRSTRIKVRKTGDRFIFQGRGWGHGVGMCQFGAKQLAEMGYRYPDILRYYYPESEIQNLEDLAATENGVALISSEEKSGGNVFKRWFQSAKNYFEEY